VRDNHASNAERARQVADGSLSRALAPGLRRIWADLVVQPLPAELRRLLERLDEPRLPSVVAGTRALAEQAGRSAFGTRTR
jgi:hypothetical protein